MLLRHQHDIQAFLATAKILTARVVVVYSHSQMRNEWTDWSGNTDTVSRRVGPAHPDIESATKSAEKNRGPGTVQGIRDTVGLELVCDQGLAILTDSFEDWPFKFRGVGASATSTISYQSLKSVVDALNKRPIHFTYIDLYKGKEIPVFRVFSEGMDLFRRHAKAGGRMNGLAWAMRPKVVTVDSIFDLCRAITESVETAESNLETKHQAATLSDNRTIKVVLRKQSDIQDVPDFDNAGESIKEDAGCQPVPPETISTDLPSSDDALEVQDQDTVPVEEPPNDSPLDETEREQVTKARIGQGLYRKNLEEIETYCRVTGLAIKIHLRASHMKPWRVCSDAEKLDGNNGLLLSPHIDHLFDKGYISFSDGGDLLVSGNIDMAVLKAWGIQTPFNAGPFNPRQRYYLAYHREIIFQK